MMIQKHKKILNYIVVLICILVMSWEQAYSQPVLWEHQELPEDAIRLRVLPNSDRPVDQWLKLQVRDEITAHMQNWALDIQSKDQADAEILKQLEALQTIAESVVRIEGFSYPVTVQFGMSEFPTVKYGQIQYPAGSYRAVVIEIGAATGKNWWCVLYPPLCLIDIVSATVVEEDSTETKKISTQTDEKAKPQVKFFLAKLFKR